MEKQIKFIKEESGIKVYQYYFNGDNIHIIQEAQKEIIFQGKNTTLNIFFKTEEYRQVCEYFKNNNE